jgi:hypothetical protein
MCRERQRLSMSERAHVLRHGVADGSEESLHPPFLPSIDLRTIKISIEVVVDTID